MHVLRVGDRLKVDRADTLAVSAQVVELEAVRNGADGVLVSPPMGHALPCTGVVTEARVAESIESASPFPARLSFVYLCPEPCLRGQAMRSPIQRIAVAADFQTMPVAERSVPRATSAALDFTHHNAGAVHRAFALAAVAEVVDAMLVNTGTRDGHLRILRHQEYTIH